MTAKIEVSHSLDEADRALYGTLVDIIIPASGHMPSATEAEVPTKWVDRVLRARPDLYRTLQVVLQKVRSTDAPHKAALDSLNETDPAEFEAFGSLTAGAYYLDPAVRERVGYLDEDSRPVADDSDAYQDLIARVRHRGAVYRRPPTG